MWRDLPEEAQARDLQRSTILALAGFSFTAIVGIALLDDKNRVALELPTWYVVVSFVSFLAAANLQSYKSTVWQNQVSAGLVECGALSLTLAVIALVYITQFSSSMKLSVAILGSGVWALDHLVRLKLDWSILRSTR